MEEMNSHWQKLASVSLLTLLATACGSPSEATRTVDYYRAHSDVRDTKIRECANNPGALRDTPNCINAQRAGELEGIGSMRKLPPMGLLPRTGAPTEEPKVPPQSGSK